MKQIEEAIALPVRQIVNPIRLAVGGAVVAAGTALLARLLALG
ncbi:MAG: hypothetical protein ABW184_08920 [Sphingobium sp.]